MREILFRGKRLDNGEWVYGSFVSWSDGSASIDTVGSYEQPIYAVDTSTVGQYTGLTDKNGVKVFEGDIMEFNAYGMHYVGVVTIYNANASIICGEKASPFLDDAIEKRRALVIGNIHDNPELLEGVV